MYLIDSLADLPHHKSNARFGQRLRFFELMIELSSGSYFEYNINVGNIIKTTIHFDDVRMVKKHLDLDLPDELLSNFFFMQQFFLYHFESTNET